MNCGLINCLGGVDGVVPLLLPTPIFFSFSGCSSNTRIALSAAPDQESLTRDGVPALVSKHKYVVMLRPASAVIRSSGRPSFVVAVYNPTKAPSELRVSGITARQIDSKNQAANVHVFTYEELIVEVQRKQRWATFAVALGGAANAMAASSAGYTHTTGVYSGSTYGTYSGSLNGTYTGSTTGIYTATTYDSGRAYAAQQIASAQTAANFAAIQANGQQALDALQNAVLKDNTVMPGEWIGGVVVLDSPTEANGAASYSIDVRIGGEIHTFAVNQARAS
jgi:hypothetical protein